jgi:hypothetical protein
MGARISSDMELELVVGYESGLQPSGIGWAVT